MKLSRFHILFKEGNDYFLYNTKTLALIKISESVFAQLKTIEQKGLSLENCPEDFISVLRKNNFVSEAGNSDTDYCYKLEYRKRMESFGGKTLSLVIAPTLACNFACPYCYEKDLPLSIMSEDVENAIVDFINKFGETCEKLELCWEGGEPLIAFDKMKSLLNKIKSKSKLKINYQSIVTNGYLINSDVCDFLHSEGFNFVQITIDGKKETHNKTRILKSGQPTYDKILTNVDMLSERAPECVVAIRTNIHTGNKDEYSEVFSFLSKRWQGRNVKIVPAFVQPSDSCDVKCFSSGEKSEFMLELRKKQGFVFGDLDVRIKPGKCTATKENCYVIDPEGNLYKCWNDIGKVESRVGTVFDGITNNALIARYVLGSDKFRDERCTNCNLFPICDGGCNRLRMDNQDKGTDYDYCPFDEKCISSYLYENYKHKTGENKH